MNSNIFICSATKGDREDTLLYKSLKAHNLLDIAYIHENNKDPLPQVYNKAMDFAKENDIEYLILLHDDITLESFDICDRVRKSLDLFDVIGVAGCTKAKIKKPTLWHLMSREFKGNCNKGAVSHPVITEDGDSEKLVTCFGSFPHRVLLLDGVFLAMSKKVFSSVRFDESNPAGFHHYDLDFSLACNKAKFKLGVCDIMITHASPGLKSLEDKEWNKGQDWFLNKWKAKQYTNTSILEE
jgi:hypothetical protein